MKSYVVDSLTFVIESGKLRRWEAWLIRHIRERIVREEMSAR